jgi:hypothetical protein
MGGACPSPFPNRSALETDPSAPRPTATGTILSDAATTGAATGAGNSRQVKIPEEKIMDLLSSAHLNPLTIAASVIYAVIGFVIFAAALFIMTRIAPFSIHKEIEHDQNTALAILMGSVFIALSIIIHAAIK